jgi:hypothetical protein
MHIAVVRMVDGLGTKERLMKYRGTLAKALMTAGLVAGAIGIPLAATATAAQSTMPIECGGQTFVIRTNNNNSSDHGGWSSAQIVGEGHGHLIPVAFSGVAVDTTAQGQPVIFQFDQQKGGGHANHNQATTTCTATITGAFADFAEGETPPPGVLPTDTVVLTINVTAVQK